MKGNKLLKIMLRWKDTDKHNKKLDNILELNKEQGKTLTEYFYEQALQFDKAGEQNEIDNLLSKLGFKPFIEVEVKVDGHFYKGIYKGIYLYYEYNPERCFNIFIKEDCNTFRFGLSDILITNKK